MRGSEKERGEGQRAGEGHYCICMCAQVLHSPESGSCWAEKEFHQNWHAKIRLTRGMLWSKAVSCQGWLVSCWWPRQVLPTLTTLNPTLELQERN